MHTIKCDEVPLRVRGSKMSKLLIEGGTPLVGEIAISAAKNSYLPILAACVLCEGEVVLHNYPAYSDTESMIKILESLGVKVTKSEKDVAIVCDSLFSWAIESELASKVRSSIFMLGALLGKFKRAKVAYPGGCEIGARPIDIHLSGFRKLGVKVEEKHGYIYCNAENMHSGKVLLEFPSVGATESLMMASVLNPGETRLVNAAKEPEIVDLQNFLNAMGADVSGAGSGEIVIRGVKKLSSCEWSPMPDRIIAGTYMIATAMCGGEVLLKGVKAEYLQAIIDKMDKTACLIDAKGDNIKVVASNKPIAMGKLETSVYPGLPTDLQAQLLALSCISEGSTMIVENVFESRFKHVPELIKMGADVHIKDRVAFVRGVKKLSGASVTGMELRGTASLVLAGLVAEGYTTVSGIKHIDRGYYKIENDLAALGAKIKRIEE